ncbi:TPA: major capsid protein [Enterococcus faecium]
MKVNIRKETLMKMDLQHFAGPLNIFDLVQAPNIATYWSEKVNAMQPYLGEELFPADKQLGMKLSWLKGKTGSPVALRPSAFDADVIPRGRAGFEELIEKMVFFKESYYIDEELRQQLNMINQTNNAAYRDTILNRIFDDVADLLRGAAVRREIMRMQMLTTGVITIEENGQSHNIEYDLPDNHKGTTSTSWSDFEKADPIEDIEKAILVMQEDGVTPARAIMNSTTFRQLRKNATIKATILGNSANAASAKLSKQALLDYIAEELNLEIVVYDKVYTDGKGTHKFIPDSTFVLLPAQTLGKTWFGTTPEESDLMAGTNATVSIVDTGVAVTTMKKADPVNVETKVSMLSLPSFEQADAVYILTTETPAP